jgi:ferredoxin
MIETRLDPLYSFLNKHDEKSWSEVLSKLIPLIHPVDQTATQIWFSFWPLKLSRSLQQSTDPILTAKKMQLDGRYRLEEQIDSSVQFLCGSRYWPEVKKAILSFAETGEDPERIGLERLIHDVANNVAVKAKTSSSILLGITAIACMILQQVGPLSFSAAAHNPSMASKQDMNPDQVLKGRNKEAQGRFFNFLKTGDKYTITFDENSAECTFQAIRLQDLSMACATDKRDYKSKDHRRIEGPIPCQCRSGACGYCWVGILSGKEKLSEITEFEKKRLNYFGYVLAARNGETHPHIRLACQSKCYGGVSVVIPPWNGVLDGRT